MHTNWIALADIIDIAIVTLLIYAALIWFKRTKAVLVVVGIVILGAVYALAKHMNLFLTTAALQGFFAVLLIAIIVIFQEELRHFFERVALWGLGRHKRTDSPEPVVALVGTATDLARAKVGALIVIAGRDPLERHAEGGTVLDGKPSEALLKSIFDQSSPGHDGAVIVNDGRISRFAVHLPLSKNLAKLSGVGTRHAAALGLAERCDAMCIVVSEERGTISIARDGELILLKDVEQLSRIIQEFLDEKFPPQTESRFKGIISRNKREKLIAVALAVGLWAMFAYKTAVVQRDLFIPIEFKNIAPGLAIERSFPHEILVTISGEERSFRLLNQKDLRATFDLSNMSEGKDRIPVNAASISSIPSGLSLNSIRPLEIDVLLKNDMGK